MIALHTYECIPLIYSNACMHAHVIYTSIDNNACMLVICVPYFDGAHTYHYNVGIHYYKLQYMQSCLLSSKVCVGREIV